MNWIGISYLKVEFLLALVNWRLECLIWLLLIRYYLFKIIILCHLLLTLMTKWFGMLDYVMSFLEWYMKCQNMVWFHPSTRILKNVKLAWLLNLQNIYCPMLLEIRLFWNLYTVTCVIFTLLLLWDIKDMWSPVTSPADGGKIGLCDIHMHHSHWTIKKYYT